MSCRALTFGLTIVKMSDTGQAGVVRLAGPRPTGPAAGLAKRMKKIVVIGEILSEIMADVPGRGFLRPIALTGPYPSGAPAIFASQAARLAQPCAIVSAVGRDDFGRLNLDRLRNDGVDVSAVRVDPELPTGTAFVRYRPDGSRDFVFNIRHSACGRFPGSEEARRIFDAADHLHVMGSSLSTPDYIAANLDLAAQIRARGGTVSFDPNLRKEMLGAPGIRPAMDRLLALSNLFLPSGEELTLLTDAETAEGAMRELLARGVAAIVHKQGRDGARYVDAHDDFGLPSFDVEETDPTGAGDCFGAAFTTFWLRGAPPRDCLLHAVAAGAHAVTVRGPMEGAADLATLRAFLAGRRPPAR